MNITTDSTTTGDNINVYAIWDTIVGYNTLPINPGDTVLNVSQTVVDNIQTGFNFVITNGVHTQGYDDSHVCVLTIDKINKQMNDNSEL